MSKNIIICYDGTGNEYNDCNTNVVKTFENTVRDEDQIAFYDPGVGTFSPFGSNLGKKIDIILGKAFGYGLRENIEDGYEYLMNYFVPGDKVFIFGFSRGAFTARKLVDLLHHFGLLQQGAKNLIPYVSKMYTSRDFKNAAGFKETFCNPCKPHFIGVWDTVASLGYFPGKKFFNLTLNRDVQNAYQAVAIDEKRKKFPVSLWSENHKHSNQTIEQVWFAGVHSDVGGYYTDAGLSDIALGWMLNNAARHGMKLKNNWEENLAQNYAGKLHNSHTGFWRIWPKVHRKIPPNSNIHQSVMDRKNADKNYRPANLPE